MLNGIETIPGLIRIKSNWMSSDAEAQHGGASLRRPGLAPLRQRKRYGRPLTRKTWIALAYGADKPDPWTPHDEMEVPEPFQYAED
jgi:hypothetical protein